MISPDALAAWRSGHPWPDDDQGEQDLVMTRVAIEIALHSELGERLAWRGGTCLHKLFLPAPLRYSEDLDYVAYDLSIADNDMRRLRSGLRAVAEHIGLDIASYATTTRNRLTERFMYTSMVGRTRRVKVEVNLDDDQLGHAAAHYLFHAGIHPAQFRAQLAAHLEDPDFVEDVAVYLLDPTAADDPGTLVHRWIRWSDRHLDLPHARLAFERSPSKRKQHAIATAESSHSNGTQRCPVREFDGSNWRRCPQHTTGVDVCADHDRT